MTAYFICNGKLLNPDDTEIDMPALPRAGERVRMDMAPDAAFRVEDVETVIAGGTASYIVTLRQEQKEGLGHIFMRCLEPVALQKPFVAAGCAAAQN